MTSTVAADATSSAAHQARSPVPGGAFAAVAGALALAVCNVLSGFYAGGGSTTDTMMWFRDNAALAEAVDASGLVAVVLLVPGIWAITHLLRRRTPRLAAIGGWLMATGYVMSSVLAIENLTTLAILSAGVEPALVAAAMDSHVPTTLTVLYFVFGLGALIGTLVVGVAMLRQRGAVPLWAGIALVVSPVVRMAGLATGLTLIGPPLASVLIAAGFFGVVRARRHI